MLLSQMLAVALSLTATQGSRDPVDVTRDAFNTCLRNFVNTGINGHKTVTEIRSQLAQQCSTEESAYRAAMIRSDLAVRISQADAESNAAQEVSSSRENASELVQEAQPH